jgi:hypothetical protein
MCKDPEAGEHIDENGAREPLYVSYTQQTSYKHKMQSGHWTGKREISSATSQIASQCGMKRGEREFTLKTRRGMMQITCENLILRKLHESCVAP